MPKTAPKAEVGTIKVGRWTYPARRYEDGAVMHETKTGWTESPKPDAFVPAHPGLALVPGGKAPAVAKKATKVPSKAAKTASAAPARTKHEWKIGGKCPNGHKLTKDTLYVMPSGRHQCRVCRAALRAAAKPVML
jgi:hypothetical protein